MVVGRLLSYWEGNFSGAMLNFRGVLFFFQLAVRNHVIFGFQPKNPGVFESLNLQSHENLRNFRVSWKTGDLGTCPHHSHTIHGTGIFYLHLVDVYDECRYINNDTIHGCDAMIVGLFFPSPHKKGSLHIEPEKSVGGFLMVRVKGGWKDSDMNSKNNE